MNGVNRLIDIIKKYPVVAIVVILAAIVTLTATCMDSPEKIIPLNHKYPTSLGKENLLGTWVSEQWPNQNHIFTVDKVKYTELEYSVFLEGSGTYTFEPDGTVEWTITWYSGNFTNWKGVLEGDKMTVEFENSWDGSRGNDTLTKVQATK